LSLTPLRNLDDTAKLLGVSVRTVRRLVVRGDLVAVRLGGRVLFHDEDLRTLISNQRVKQGDPIAA
jgi:excisionase family DNA binding protein